MTERTRKRHAQPPPIGDSWRKRKREEDVRDLNKFQRLVKKAFVRFAIRHLRAVVLRCMWAGVAGSSTEPNFANRCFKVYRYPKRNHDGFLEDHWDGPYSSYAGPRTANIESRLSSWLYTREAFRQQRPYTGSAAKIRTFGIDAGGHNLSWRPE